MTRSTGDDKIIQEELKNQQHPRRSWDDGLDRLAAALKDKMVFADEILREAAELLHVKK